MTDLLGNRALVALIDDDVHSARLLLRTLADFGVADARWLGDAERGARLLDQMSETTPAALPGMIIVDLKTSSLATAAFVTRIGHIVQQADIVVAAMMLDADDAKRDMLLGAGAHAVFERHAEFDVYRQEAASIARYWARSTRLEATGS